MRLSLLPIVASFALLAAPAFAAMPGATAPNPQAANPSQDAASNSMQVSRSTQQKLEQSLEQSGFRDVTVAPRTFIIHARAPDGSHIVMVVGPDRAHGVIMSGSSSPPNPSMRNGSMNAEHNGMSNTEQGK